MMKKNLFIMLLLIGVNVIAAQDINSLNYRKTTVANAPASNADEGNVVMSVQKYTTLPQSEQKRISGIFNLKPKDYASYLHYMNDTMDGYEYQKKG